MMSEETTLTMYPLLIYQTAAGWVIDGQPDAQRHDAKIKQALIELPELVAELFAGGEIECDACGHDVELDDGGYPFGFMLIVSNDLPRSLVSLICRACAATPSQEVFEKVKRTTMERVAP